MQYLLHRPTWHKLPMLPRMYSTEFSAPQVDRDTATLMQLAHTRCPQGVELLKSKHRLATSQALIEQLPARRRRRHVGAKLLAVVRRAYGVTAYDPLRSIARRHIRSGARRA